MTSLINPQNIDITFPVAGQDNDTQGFRTNYQNIRNNFTVAASEISALQANVSSVFTSNLTVQGNLITANITSATSNVTVNSNLKVNNSLTVNNGLYSISNFTGIYSDGVVVDYVTGVGRISVGSGDVLTFYAGGPANTQTMSIASNAVVSLASAIQFANLTTAQVTAIATPARGMTIYNYTTGNIQVYNGTKWANVTLS